MGRVSEVDDSTFEAEVLRASGPVLVDFSAVWCGPCKKLEPMVQDLAVTYAERLKVVKVDVDRAPVTAARYAVLSVPTLLFFRDGELRDTHVGLPTRGMLDQRVQKVL